MAKTTIRFRFTFNRGGEKGGLQKRTARAVNGAIQNVVFEYARGTYRDIQTRIKANVSRDIRAEISWIAGLFKQSVIGIHGRRTAPKGYIGMTHELASVSLPLGIKPRASAGQGISWPKRSKRYMAWKRANNYGDRWFKNRGKVLPSLMGKTETWVGAFGPIVVRVSPMPRSGAVSSANLGRLSSREFVSRGGRSRYKDTESSRIVEGVARIEVAALTNITPSMLPGLASGEMGSYAADGRETGLIGMLPSEAAIRLGGSSDHVPYRHTVEPFLTFVLTRSVPNALFLRMEKGLGVSLQPTKRKT